MNVINTETHDLSGNVEKLNINDFAKALNLNVVFEGRGEILISSISITRPGLQLTGYFSYFDNDRIQLVGRPENSYLVSMEAEEREKNLDLLFSKNIPCMIVTDNLEVMPEILKYAKKYNCPLFTSKQIAAVVTHELTIYQSELLAPTIVMHGVFVEVFGVGVLITGHAGVGKSETALELITRGHRLVSDDSVVIKNVGETLVCKAPENIRHYMEVRGIGIINVQTMFGPGAIRLLKTVDIIIDLAKWEEGKSYERLGDVKQTQTILGIDLPKHTIPVSPGRNIPVIIETAARKYRLDQTGYDATQELINKTFKQ